MAGFKMHISTSSVLGVGYGAAAFALYQVPAPACILAAGLCGVSGMLPDLDSGPGRPLRESLGFAAAVVPMMMIDRFEAMGMSLEMMTLIGGAIYFFIRFGVAWMLRHYTVHRGMFHSIPAAIIFAQIAFLICSSDSLAIRYFKAGGVLVGFMSHLILDEIYSIDFSSGVPKLKKSFGTAVKFWGDNMWSNISCYAKLAIMTYLMLQDPVWMNSMRPEGQQLEQMATRAFHRATR